MNNKIIFGIIIALIFGSISVYAGTKFYASDVSVSAPTGSNLGSNATLQDSLDELYSLADNSDEVSSIKKELAALKTTVSNLQNNTLDKIYPVGSIYISTSITTASEVTNKIGGTWEVYGSGRTLISSGSNGETSYTAGTTGGSSKVTLKNTNLPIHNHHIPQLQVSSWTGIHSHTQVVTAGGSSQLGYVRYDYSGEGAAGRYSQGVNTDDAQITVSGQTTTATNTDSCINCSGSAFSVQNPYIVVYMYKRTK
mgnify:CR=1 FL=1